jgi:hypothetical protein
LLGSIGILLTSFGCQNSDSSKTSDSCTAQDVMKTDSFCFKVVGAKSTVNAVMVAQRKIFLEDESNYAYAQTLQELKQDRYNGLDVNSTGLPYEFSMELADNNQVVVRADPTEENLSSFVGLLVIEPNNLDPNQPREYQGVSIICESEALSQEPLEVPKLEKESGELLMSCPNP